MRYTRIPEAELDNNGVENAIGPVALRRRNWLFAGSESGGRLSQLLDGQGLDLRPCLLKQLVLDAIEPFRAPAEEAIARGTQDVFLLLEPLAGLLEFDIALLELVRDPR